MNWISNVVRPRIRSFLTTKREVPDNLWIQCPESGQMVFHKDLEANQFVVPGSDYHMRMAAQERMKSVFDDGAYDRVKLPTVPQDPLKFRDGRRYADRLRDAKQNTALEDAVLVGEGNLEGRPVVVAVQDFRFMGGSLGMAAGEAVIAGMMRAVERKSPFILFAASGGARMQEGILSLMQMPRTTIAVQALRDAGLPYIVVLTDPTTGGVTASYAMLGDVHIAEPGALICFAGPRVIEQTIREQLPEGFQRAEYLLDHGMIDMVVHRHKMRETLARLCRVLGPQPVAKATGDAVAGNVPALPSPEASAEMARTRNGHDTSADALSADAQEGGATATDAGHGDEDAAISGQDAAGRTASGASAPTDDGSAGGDDGVAGDGEAGDDNSHEDHAATKPGDSGIFSSLGLGGATRASAKPAASKKVAKPGDKTPEPAAKADADRKGKRKTEPGPQANAASPPADDPAARDDGQAKT